MNSAAPRGIFGGASLQKAIAQGIASGDATFKGPRSGVGMEGVLKEASRKGRLADRGSELDQIRVRGLKQSKAAANPDGGVKDLLSFLERKATGSEPSARNSVRIRKVCQLLLRTAGRPSPRNFAFSAPLSFQANLSERRPRRTILVAAAFG